MQRRRFLQSVMAAGLAGSAARAQQSATPAVISDANAAAGKIPRVTDAGELAKPSRPLGWAARILANPH
jgi:hypothetical protein